MVIWTLKEAIEVINMLDAEYETSGWRFGLTGGVLRNGSSRKDLDIIAYPHKSVREDSYESVIALRELLVSKGWKLRVSGREMRRYWLSKGSYDEKHVECWVGPGGRRVDVFIME